MPIARRITAVTRSHWAAWPPDWPVSRRSVRGRGYRFLPPKQTARFTERAAPQARLTAAGSPAFQCLIVRRSRRLRTPAGGSVHSLYRLGWQTNVDHASAFPATRSGRPGVVLKWSRPSCPLASVSAREYR